MPVAQREIVEARGSGPCRCDWIARIDPLLQDAAHAAVCESDAKILQWALCLIEKSSGVVVGNALRERCAQERAFEFVEQNHAGRQHDSHVSRYAVQALCTRPDTFDQGGVVVAGQHDPRAGKARERAEQAADDRVGDGLLIEYVAGHQHCIDAARGGLTGNQAHRFETRFGEMRSFLGVELAELRADLPVCGVQESDHGVPILRML